MSLTDALAWVRQDTAFWEMPDGGGSYAGSTTHGPAHSQGSHSGPSRRQAAGWCVGTVPLATVISGLPALCALKRFKANALWAAAASCPDAHSSFRPQ